MTERLNFESVLKSTLHKHNTRHTKNKGASMRYYNSTEALSMGVSDQNL